jgi:hypothetical protein
MKEQCSSAGYGWSKARYSNVVAAIAASLDAPITSFAGSSFAAHRLAWLRTDARFRITHAALSNPLLPGLSISDVFRHQAQGVTALLDGMADAYVPSGVLLSAAASQLPGIVSPVTNSLSRSTPEQIGLLSDEYLGRYGDDQLSLGRLAYYQEMCSAGFAAPGRPSWSGSRREVYEYLVAMHGGCPGDAVHQSEFFDTNLAVCVTASGADAIIPHQALMRLLEDVAPIVNTSPHINIKSLGTCRDFIMERP